MKMSALISLLLIFSMLGTSNCLGHGTGIVGSLEGKITDKETGECISGVTVFVIGLGVGSVSDSLGHYQITGIRAGMYDIRFQMVGYQTTTLRKVAILPDFRTRIDVEIKQSSVELEPVEVRAESPLIQKDKAGTVYQFSESQMEMLPISHVNDALTLMPGVTREGNVRGGKTNEVIYLLDGLPVQDVISGGMSLELPKSAAETMTMWTGGFDAEYGNALSGVVNIESRSGSSVPQFEVRYERDHWLSDRMVQQTDKADEAEFFASGPMLNGQLSYLTSNCLSVSNTRWWQDVQHFFSSPIHRELTGLTRLEYIPSTTFRLVLQGVYALQKWKDYEYRWRFNLSGIPQRQKDMYRGTLMLTHVVSPQSFYSVTLGYSTQYSHIGSDSKNQLSLVPYQYDVFLRFIVAGVKNWWAETRQGIFTLKADYTLQALTLHTLKLGGEINQYDIYGNIVKLEPQITYFGKPIPDVPLLNYSNFYQYHPRIGAIFIQDKVEFIRDGAFLNIGLRWDFLDPAAERPIVEFVPTKPGEFQQQVSGHTSASLKQQMSTRFSFTVPTGLKGCIFTNYGRYIQFPLFEYLYSGITPTQLQYGAKNVLAGNPDLEPERLSAWELGVKQQIKEYWTASLVYFQKRITNQIDTKTIIPFDSKYTGDYGYATYVNLDEANVKGFEVVVTYESTRWLNGFISYTNMSTEGLSDQANQNANIAQWGFPVPLRPYPLSWDQRHTVKLNLNVRFPRDVESDLYAEYHSPRPYTYYPTRDGFIPLDPNKSFLPNNYRMMDVFLMDFKIQKNLHSPFSWAVNLVFYADVRNILNTRNVLWIDSNGRIGGELDDPSAYDTGRRVRIGMSALF